MSRLLFIGGLEASQANVDYVAEQLGTVVEASDVAGITWYDAAHDPRAVEVAADGAIVATHSMGASIFECIRNSCDHPAIAARRIILMMAPRKLGAGEYLRGIRDYDSVLAQHPAIQSRVHRLHAKRPEVAIPDHKSWAIRQIIGRYVTGRQIDRIALAHSISRHRGDHKTSVLIAEYDQYFPPTAQEVAYADKIGLPVSYIAWTHDIVADPALLLVKHMRRIGE